MTESPLIGRGSALPGNLDHLSQLNNDDDDIMYGRDDNDDFQSLVGGNSQPNFGLLPSPQRKAASTQDFELFGPAAAVDTQTAGTSQWVRQALDIESENFLEYVEEALKEKRGDELEGEGGEGEDLGARGKQRFVTFGELVQEDKHNVIVATQAFYHVLTLATRGRIWAEQVDEEVMGGEIRVGVVG
jgi:meiotic recombination protein REC8